MKKKIETDIEKLKKQRRLNVQEQIILTRDRILTEANYWRQNGVPAPLLDVFKKYEIDFERSIILDYEQDFPDIITDEGIVLTPHGIFYEFIADLNSDRTELIELYSIKDVSDRFEVEANKRGIGMTYGFLALEVLKELNKD